MYAEVFSGLHTDARMHLQKVFTQKYDEMVVIKDIRVESFCEHHLLPFVGVAHVAYIPNGKVVGLSKIPRAIDTAGKAAADPGEAHRRRWPTCSWRRSTPGRGGRHRGESLVLLFVGRPQAGQRHGHERPPGDLQGPARDPRRGARPDPRLEALTPRPGRPMTLPMLADFAIRLAGGLAVMLAVAPWRAVPIGFFRTHCQVILGLAGLATLAATRPPFRAGRLRARAQHWRYSRSPPRWRGGSACRASAYRPLWRSRRRRRSSSRSRPRAGPGTAGH